MFDVEGRHGGPRRREGGLDIAQQALQDLGFGFSGMNEAGQRPRPSIIVRSKRSSGLWPHWGCAALRTAKAVKRVPSELDGISGYRGRSGSR